MTYLGVFVGDHGLPGADQAVVGLEAAFAVPVHPAAEHGGFPLVGEIGVHRMDDAGRGLTFLTAALYAVRGRDVAVGVGTHPGWGLTFLTAALYAVCGRDLACVVVDDPG